MEHSAVIGTGVGAPVAGIGLLQVGHQATRHENLLRYAMGAWQVPGRADGGGGGLAAFPADGGPGRKSAGGTGRPFAVHAADFAWCEDAVWRSSKGLYRAFSMLPEPKRQGAFAVYAFYCAASDCVERDRSRAALGMLRVRLGRLFRGEVPDLPLWRALAVTCAEFGLARQPFYDMLEGWRRDCAFRQPGTLHDLEEYAHDAADSAALMLLPLLCTEARPDVGLRASVMSLGAAMRLTAVLCSVGEDLSAGRVYLPAELMAEVGCTREGLAAGVADEPFRYVWETVARRAEVLYLPMQCDIGLLDEDSRLPVLSLLYLCRGILNAVRDEGYRCLGKRCSVPALRASELLAAAAAQARRAGQAGVAPLGDRAQPAGFAKRL